MANGKDQQHSLIEGLLESLITEELQRRLGTQNDLEAHIEGLDQADEPHVLARHLARVVETELSGRKPETRREVVNALLDRLDVPDERLSGDSRPLLSLVPPPAPGVTPRSTTRPATPLSDAALLTNAHGEPSIGSEIRAELASADEVDVVLAFVKWHGLRLLERELTELRERGVPLRVITTTYIGATEREALDRLVRDFGAHVKVHYDTQRTRLHAKAWLFRRNTGFDTAYVGSSNLSRSALLDGVEWNVRLSSVATPALLSKFRATFDSYWHDTAYETYDPDQHGDRLDDALVEARGGPSSGRVTLTLSGLEVRAYPYQAEMLEQLEVERRVHDRHRNLLVAATGTGKTVVAALDYRRLAREAGERPTLLFVAHRKEILEQSLRTYREVLGDPDFGELYVAGRRPERWQHVFASVQSLTSYGVTRIPGDAFTMVVIDEFHHAEAATYRRIVEQLSPRELLGLTATPERGDGKDVRQWFDGRTAAELRLWDALSADLLTPFHYFGIADGTDLRRIDWKAGAYDTTALSNVFTGNDARARLVLQAVRDKIVQPVGMKALGFCVDTAHAAYMAQVFTDAGLPSATVLGTTPLAERERAIGDLKAGRIVAIFTVDVFNEGVDIPAINTVFFLRPTESATVF
ncbi:MAG: DEAD/DEAH box helicase family protein, partial [Ornithinimicrobium sp.]